MADKLVSVANDGVQKLLKGQLNGSHAEAQVDVGGEAGVRVTTGTAAQTGVWSVIQILEDATFTVLTESGVAANSDAMTGFVIPAGVVLKGAFTAYTLASGKVRAYV